MSSMGVFIKKFNPYLVSVSQGSKKTTENSEILGRPAQLCLKPVPHVYQVREPNLAANGEACKY